MNHQFAPHQLDESKCRVCKRDMIDHTDRATCESCGASGIMELHVDILMCSACIQKELSAQADSKAAAEQRVKEMYERMNLNRVLEMSKQVDNSIQLHTDIFNAKTVAIVELQKSIQDDDTIPAEQKHFKLAEVVSDRFKHLTQVIFDANQTKINAQNEQKAIQVYLNGLVEKLSKEEREKLKLHDIEYKPSDKPIKKPKAPKVVKFDKAEIKKVCDELTKELGFPVIESMIQMICVSKGMNPEQAANSFRRSVKETDSMTEN